MKPRRSFYNFPLLFAFLSSLLTDAKITTPKIVDDGMVTLSLPTVRSERPSAELETVHSRTRRDTTDNAPSVPSNHVTTDSSKLGVHTTILPDESHNEAIVHWTGNSSTVMFILSRQRVANGSVPSSKLWRSDNYGKSFHDVTNLPKDALIAYYLAAPSDKKKLIFVDQKNNNLHVTSDEGVTYTTRKGCGPESASSDKITFHPSNPDYLLCYYQAEKQLWVSRDFAASWQKVDNYVNPRYFWGVRGQNEDYVVHMEVFDPLTSEYLYKAKSCQGINIYEVTMDPTLGAIQVDSLLVMDEYIFVQKASQYATWLYVSWMRQPFKMAFFPRNHHPEDLNILNADEGQVFVAGSQPSSSYYYTISTLYLSDMTGQFYTTSLESVTDVGLREVQGLRGVFIANQKKGLGSHSGLQSVITFDQGGNWVRIPAPEKDTANKTINCKIENGCSLHLTHVISEKNAPGVLLGMGNYGDMLHGYENTTLLMSTDGGTSWKFVLAETDRYEANILDQGGAVVVVPQHVQQTGKENLIHYSHDEGRHWYTYKYTNDTMRVDAVLNDPGIETRTVVIFGHDEAQPGWVIVMVDFTSILSRQCNNNTDYMDWFPTDMVPNHQCLLGQKLTYRRRKPDSECYNGRNYEKAVSTKLCKCVMEDYECDYGYIQNTTTKKCSVASWFDVNRPVGSCEEGHMYNKSSGYRKVASDKCTPELSALTPTLTPCPLMKAEGLHLLLSGRRVVHVGQSAQFILVQERGSKVSTSYTWTFGDSTPPVTKKGFDAAANQTHTFTKRGTFQVSVLAENKNGKTSVSQTVLVEEMIEGLVVNLPHGSQVGFPVLFEVTLGDKFDPFFLIQPGVHFMWKFGDEMSDRDAKLTFDTTVRHTYKKASNYTVFVEAMNGGDSVFRMLTVPVYGTLTIHQLTFEDTLDLINDGTVIWQDLFAHRLHEALAKTQNIDMSRLEVVVLKDTSRTVAEVSVLPTSQELTSDSSIDKISKTLQNLPGSDFRVLLSRDDFRIDSLQPYLFIRVTSVKVIQVDPDGSGTNNYLAVYVCVPILVSAIFVSMLVILYYKKTFSSQARRYRLLRSQQAEGPGEPDSLLDDTDDDDPPLDLGGPGDSQRLRLSEDDQMVRGVGDPLGLLSSDQRNLEV